MHTFVPGSQNLRAERRSEEEDTNIVTHRHDIPPFGAYIFGIVQKQTRLFARPICRIAHLSTTTLVVRLPAIVYGKFTTIHISLYLLRTEYPGLLSSPETWSRRVSS